MNAETILIVEDNDITRKMMRVALELEGFRVLEAERGFSALKRMAEEAPDLVLQDYILPDIGGIDLVRALRAVPGGSGVPIIAVTGFLSRLEEGELTSAPFDAVLAKPVEPSRLVAVVRGHLSRPAEECARSGRGRRLLLVDDDPVQLKLARIVLVRLGFDVLSVESARAALELAEKEAVDAILSDVLMPGMDGFRLCLAVRSSGHLSSLPVVLVSSHYQDPRDMDLAKQVGASALVSRTPDLAEAVGALLASLSAEAPPRPAAGTALPEQAYMDRVLRQLERQVALNAGLSQRVALQGTILSVVASLSDTLARRADLTSVLPQVLHAILDVGGVSKGALFLRDGEGHVTVAAACGYSADERDALAGLVGCEEVVSKVVGKGKIVSLPSPEVPPAIGNEILSGLGAKSALLVPLVAREDRLGMLLIACAHRCLDDEDWIPFSSTMGIQIGQAIALSRVVSEHNASSLRYRTLMEQASDGIYVLTPEGVILEANARGEEIQALPRSAIVGHRFDDFVAPEQREEERRRWNQLLARGSIHAENVMLRRGEQDRAYVDFSARVIDVGGEKLVFAIAHDATERNRLQLQVYESQKMEAVGQLTGGVAHDFNNLLAAILLNCGFLMGQLAEGDPRRADVEEIKSAADRAASLTRQLLAFSRKQVLDPRVLDLNAIVSGMEKMFRRILREDIDLVTALENGLGAVKADAGQIEQVLMNLTVNARDAMPEGGTLTIETANVELDEGYARGHPPLQPGRYVLLAVTDTGTGMELETQRRIFEPFFTTKERGKGTGLGLSTSYGIVKQSGGFIWVYSEPGRGTVFKVYLPRIDQRPEERAGSKAVEELSGTETILLVEDDDRLRIATKRILESNGYRVKATRDSGEAFSLFRDEHDTIDLVITDCVLPGASGPALAERLKSSSERTKVLFISGYPDHAVLRGGLLQPGVNFLQKPFTPEGLYAKVRQLLDA